MAVDLDDAATWTADVVAWSRQWVGRMAPVAGRAGDLEPPPDDEATAERLLEGHPILAFHCTRVLDYELAAIREQGLRASSRELVEGRIREAHEGDLLTDQQREQYLSSNAGDHKGREGHVWLVTGGDELRDWHHLPPRLPTRFPQTTTNNSRRRSRWSHKP